MTVREYIGDEQAAKLKLDLEDMLESEEGFLYIARPSKTKAGLKVTDLYKDICANCVAEHVGRMLHDAGHQGLLADPATEKRAHVN